MSASSDEAFGTAMAYDYGYNDDFYGTESFTGGDVKDGGMTATAVADMVSAGAAIATKTPYDYSDEVDMDGLTSKPQTQESNHRLFEDALGTPRAMQVNYNEADQNGSNPSPAYDYPANRSSLGSYDEYRSFYHGSLYGNFDPYHVAEAGERTSSEKYEKSDRAAYDYTMSDDAANTAAKKRTPPSSAGPYAQNGQVDTLLQGPYPFDYGTPVAGPPKKAAETIPIPQMKMTPPAPAPMKTTPPPAAPIKVMATIPIPTAVSKSPDDKSPLPPHKPSSSPAPSGRQSASSKESGTRKVHGIREPAPPAGSRPPAVNGTAPGRRGSAGSASTSNGKKGKNDNAAEPAQATSAAPAGSVPVHEHTPVHLPPLKQSAEAGTPVPQSTTPPAEQKQKPTPAGSDAQASPKKKDKDKEAPISTTASPVPAKSNKASDEQKVTPSLSDSPADKSAASTRKRAEPDAKSQPHVAAAVPLGTEQAPAAVVFAKGNPKSASNPTEIMAPHVPVAKPIPSPAELVAIATVNQNGGNAVPILESSATTDSDIDSMEYPMGVDDMDNGTPAKSAAPPVPTDVPGADSAKLAHAGGDTNTAPLPIAALHQGYPSQGTSSPNSGAEDRASAASGSTAADGTYQDSEEGSTTQSGSDETGEEEETEEDEMDDHSIDLAVIRPLSQQEMEELATQRPDIGIPRENGGEETHVDPFLHNIFGSCETVVIAPLYNPSEDPDFLPVPSDFNELYRIRHETLRVHRDQRQRLQQLQVAAGEFVQKRPKRRPTMRPFYGKHGTLCPTPLSAWYKNALEGSQQVRTPTLSPMKKPRESRPQQRPPQQGQHPGQGQATAAPAPDQGADQSNAPQSNWPQLQHGPLVLKRIRRTPVDGPEWWSKALNGIKRVDSIPNIDVDEREAANGHRGMQNQHHFHAMQQQHRAAMAQQQQQHQHHHQQYQMHPGANMYPGQGYGSPMLPMPGGGFMPSSPQGNYGHHGFPMNGPVNGYGMNPMQGQGRGMDPRMNYRKTKDFSTTY